MEVFSQELSVIIDQLYDQQHQNIREAARLCAQAITAGGVIQVLGSGHSVGFGWEMANRPGSLVPVHSLNMDDFVTKGKFSFEEYKDPINIFERRPGIAEQFYNLYDIRLADIFIIISNSGINGVVIDMAIQAKEKGHQLIVVTSWQHTSAEDSRHPSGKKLYEFADLVIDNCGPKGDALIETGGIEKICSISSITGAIIAQTIGSETCEFLIAANQQVPILWPETRPGYLEHNNKLKNAYLGRI